MVREVALAVVLAGVGFGAGRVWSTEPARPVAEARAARASAFPAPVAVTVAAPPEDDHVLGRRIEPALRAAWRTDPAGAMRSRTAVLEVLERRRRAVDPEVRECLREVHGLVRIRVDVAVEATGERLRVADPSGSEVTEGPPVGDAALACVEQLLAGDETVTMPPGAPALADYRGSIDYVASFALP